LLLFDHSIFANPLNILPSGFIFIFRDPCLIHYEVLRMLLAFNCDFLINCFVEIDLSLPLAINLFSDGCFAAKSPFCLELIYNICIMNLPQLILYLTQ